MNKNDKKQFDVLITGLAEMFEKKLSPTLMDLYFEALRDIGLDAVTTAAKQLALTAKFFPKPVEFREIVLPDMEAQAVLAYDKVNEATQRIGAYMSVVFDDPIIHVVLQSLGGWAKACERPEDGEKEKWWRKDFERLYRLYSSQKGITALPVLCGLADRENGNRGAELAAPVEIGDKEKIKAFQSTWLALEEKNEGG